MSRDTLAVLQGYMFNDMQAISSTPAAQWSPHFSTNSLMNRRDCGFTHSFRLGLCTACNMCHHPITMIWITQNTHKTLHLNVQTWGICTTWRKWWQDPNVPKHQQVLIQTQLDSSAWPFSDALNHLLCFYESPQVSKYQSAVGSLQTVPIFPNLLKHIQKHFFTTVEEQHKSSMWLRPTTTLTYTVRVDVQQNFPLTLKCIAA